MKFMMNGAITLGTMDGANVEIVQQVAKENCEIFGLTTAEIEELKPNYRVWDYYHNYPKIKRVIDSLVDGSWDNNREQFRVIFEELMNHNDEYFVLADLDAYLKALNHIEERYQDQAEWAKACLINIAKSGYFSSDRTIKEYVDDIWHIEKI